MHYPEITKRFSSSLWRLQMAAALVVLNAAFARGQVPFQQKLAVSLAEPTVLSVTLSHGDVLIAYSREGEVSIHASGSDTSGKSLPPDFFTASLRIEQKSNQITIQDDSGIFSPDGALSALYKIEYRIDVPFRTQVSSTIAGKGNQLLIGITGPARLSSEFGNIDASYVRFAPLEVTTKKGNISCTRVFQVNAETGDGNITLMEDGPSKAVVKSGRGRIEVGGARGSFEGSTDSGPLHIKAVLLDNWRLGSSSGSIRVELPPKAAFEVDASTVSGEISVEREEMQAPASSIRQFHEQVKGGGKRIEARTIQGTIFIQ